MAIPRSMRICKIILAYSMYEGVERVSISAEILDNVFYFLFFLYIYIFYFLPSESFNSVVFLCLLISTLPKDCTSKKYIYFFELPSELTLNCQYFEMSKVYSQHAEGEHPPNLPANWDYRQQQNVREGEGRTTQSRRRKRCGVLCIFFSILFILTLCGIVLLIYFKANLLHRHSED